MNVAQQEWIGELPIGWDTVSLRDVLIERKELNKLRQETNILSVTNDRGVINYRDKGNVGNKASDDIERYKRVYRGDIVANSMNVIIGSVGISPEDGVLSPVYIVMKPADDIDTRFYDYIFKAKGFQAQLKRIGYGILDHRMRIPWDNLKMQRLPKPDYKTQQKIADFLDTETAQIDNLITKQERLLELLEEKRRATITHAVTRGLNPSVELKETNIPWMPIVPESWSLIKLGYLVKILSGYSPEQAKPKSSGVHPFYKVDSLNSVDDAGCITSAKDYVSDSKLVEQPVFIVFPKRGGAIFTNKVAIVKNSACFDTNLMGLRPVESKLLPEFIYHWIKVRTLGELADTSTLPQINNKHIAPLPIGLPPIDEQREIVNYINTKNMQADKLMQKIQTQITLLRERRTSLISHAVTGKVRI